MGSSFICTVSIFLMYNYLLSFQCKIFGWSQSRERIFLLLQTMAENAVENHPTFSTDLTIQDIFFNYLSDHFNWPLLA